MVSSNVEKMCRQTPQKKIKKKTIFQVLLKNIAKKILNVKDLQRRISSKVLSYEFFFNHMEMLGNKELKDK